MDDVERRRWRQEIVIGIRIERNLLFRSAVHLYGTEVYQEEEDIIIILEKHGAIDRRFASLARSRPPVIVESARGAVGRFVDGLAVRYCAAMSSWRIGEHQVNQPVQRGTTGKKKKSYGDDDEFDFGAPQPKTTGRPVSTTGTGAAEQVQAGDLANPLKFSLHRIEWKRTPAEPFGIEVASSSHGVLQVSNLTAGGPAEKAGVEKGMYLFAIDGKRMNNEADMKTMECDKKRRHPRFSFLKKRPSMLQQGSFPMPGSVSKRQGHEYALLRLDPTNNLQVGIGIGERSDGAVVITAVMDNTAAKQADVRVGDCILVVDEFPVKNRQQCKSLVTKSYGSPFDLIVERKPPPPPPPPAPAPKAAPPPPPMDPNAGDPTFGVPHTPTDVSVFLDKGAKKKVFESLRVTTKKRKKKTTAGSDRSVGVDPGRSVRVKVVKRAESTKLKKP